MRPLSTSSGLGVSGNPLLSLPIPFLLWFITFYLRPISFWIGIMSSTFVLLIISRAMNSFAVNPHLFRINSFVLGLASSPLLYLVFAGGNLFLDVTGIDPSGVSGVYSLKSEIDPSLLWLLLVFPIAVGEEAYWRGLIQRYASIKWGNYRGYLLSTSAYAAVHISGLNFALIVAALTAGIFWGFLYLKTESLLATTASHAFWNLLIFMILPLR